MSEAGAAEGRSWHAGLPPAPSSRIGPRAHGAADITGLAFGTAFLVLVIGPPLLPQPFGAYPLLRLGEVLDLLTPLIVVPLGWLVFLAADSVRPTTRATTAFLVVAAVWVEGHSIHLAANAIGHFMVGGGDLVALTTALDERFSHLIWHGAVLAMAALTIRRAHRATRAPARGRTGSVIGGMLFGSAFFAASIEGTTAALVVPASLVLLAASLVPRPSATQHPVLVLFATAFGAVIVLTVAWAALNGWTLPEFSDLGWI